MNLERYGFHKKRTHKDYEFYSEGPKGRIRKIVRFSPLPLGDITCYNLSFGDWNKKNGRIDCHSITNNGDAKKILATVGAIVIHFTSIYPDAFIYAWGSNKARTRLYQMGINKMWPEISATFCVYGFINGNPEFFRKNINYDAFLIHSNEIVYLQEQTESYMISKKTGSQKKAPRTQRLVVTILEHDPDPGIQERNEEAKRRLEQINFPVEMIERFRALQQRR